MRILVMIGVYFFLFGSWLLVLHFTQTYLSSIQKKNVNEIFREISWQ